MTKKIDIKNLLSIEAKLILSLVVLTFVIEVIHLVLGYQMVDFFRIYHSVQKNAVIGMLMVPMENKTYFWLFILLYFSTIIYFFRSINKSEARNPKSETNLNDQNKNVQNDFDHSNLKHSNIVSSFDIRTSSLSHLVLLSANLMFFASIYYVGRSMPHELITISIFAILTFFLLLGSIYSTLNTRMTRAILFLLLFAFFISFPALQRKEYIVEKILNRVHSFSQGQIFASEMDNVLTNQYGNDIKLINKYLKSNDIALISADDTYLLYFTHKKNLFDINPAFAIDTQSEMGPAIKKVAQICPQQIIVDCTFQQKCPDYQTLSDRLPALPKILPEIEKKCGVFYKPTVCTDKLCIEEKQ